MQKRERIFNATLHPRKITITTVSRHRSKISNLFEKRSNVVESSAKKNNCEICNLYSSCKNRIKGLIPEVHPLLVDAPALRCFVLLGEPTGKISDVGMRKIRDSIQWMFAAAETKLVWESKYKRMVPWRINFCTLTIKKGMAELNAAGWTDVRLKGLLNGWLTMAKSRFGLKTYIWKAETQKRGVLHFHLTTDCYMHYAAVRTSWNRILTKSGLSQDEANSTDIHAVDDEQRAQEYLIKYFYKEEAKRRIVNGRLWARSNNLARLKCFVQMPEDEITEFCNDIKTDVYCASEGLYDYASVYYLKKGFWENLKQDCELSREYQSSSSKIRSAGKGIKDFKKKQSQI